MQERPIVCTPFEMENILAGIKTQFCRPVRFPRAWKEPRMREVYAPHTRIWLAYSKENASDTRHIPCPYGNPCHTPGGRLGDLLWVREAWRIKTWEGLDYAEIQYMVDLSKRFVKIPEVSLLNNNPEEWNPAITLPKNMSRVHLEVTNSDPIRLNSLSVEDLRQEGMMQYAVLHGLRNDPITAMKHYWERRYKKFPVSSNPYLWRVKVRVLE